MKKTNLKRERGFSIVEAIVAVFIFSEVLLGIMSLVIQNIQVSKVNMNMVIASQLAQEGVELARNVRDTNWLINTPTRIVSWKTGYIENPSSNIVHGGTYTIFYDPANSTTTLNSVVDINNARLNLYISGQNTGFYVHTSPAQTAPSPFYRLITVVDLGERLKVTCTVRWYQQSQPYDYEVDTYLYNWSS